MADLVKKVRTSSGDLQIDYRALANLPAINNNLLVNSDFRNTINQRGNTTYTDNSSDEKWTYTIDRWRIKNLTLTVNATSITIKNNGTSPYGFQQPIGYYLPLGTYTASCAVRSITGNAYMSVTNSNNSNNLVVGINSYTWTNVSIGSMSIVVDAGSQVELEWAKLEVGNAATTFFPRLLDEEIMICQRFYQTVSSHRFMMLMTTSNAASGHIQLVPTMRATPSVSVTSFKYLDSTLNGHVDAKNVSADTSYTKDTVVVIQIEKNSNSTLTKGSVLNGNISASFDAEIY